ncbi:MAG: PPC domain-containing protein, partial [Anaerolinea sp.]|nr:PPC domain-containing protein [Anaerolinea sp.]
SVTLTAEALSGSLDTYLIVYDPSGRVLAENDDIDTAGGIYDSQVAFIAPIDGDYTVEVTRYDGEGEFRLTVVYGVLEDERGTAVGSSATEPVVTLTGTINDAAPEQIFAIDLFANETIFVTAEATSGDLDTVLTIADAGQRVLAQNDDYNPQVSLDSALTFTSASAGTYYFVVSRYDGAAGESSGDFVLSIYRDAAADEAINAAGEPAGTLRDVTGTAEAALSLSGPTQIVETDNFRIFYTLEGDDATTPEFLQEVARAFEEAFIAQRDTLGFTPPPANNGRFDVYLYDVVGKEEDALGYAQPEQIVGDNPNTSVREVRAATAYMVIDNDYAGTAGSAAEAIRVMRATVTHELNHLFQFGYDAEEPHNWFFEATSSWIEVATFPSDEEASDY